MRPRTTHHEHNLKQGQTHACVTVGVVLAACLNEDIEREDDLHYVRHVLCAIHPLARPLRAAVSCRCLAFLPLANSILGLPGASHFSWPPPTVCAASPLAHREPRRTACHAMA